MPAGSPEPSVKDDERDAALRRDGASKEKAARIANTDATAAGARGGSPPPLLALPSIVSSVRSSA